jgi:Lipase (class 3)
MDVTKAIHFGQILDQAYDVSPTNLTNAVGTTFTVGGVTYQVVTTIYANDLATDMNPGRVNDQVSIGLICQADPAGDVVIAVRGTEGIFEWVHDFEFAKVACPFLSTAGRTDDGFTDMYTSMTVDAAPNSASVVRSLPTVKFDHPVSSVTICGHSLGGALATLLVLDLAATAANPGNTQYERFANPVAYTYASPRTGDAAFATKFNQLVPNSNRIENRLDIVPHLPPQFTGYVHVNTAYELIPTQVNYSLYCEHSITTYLYLLSLQSGGAVIPLEPQCQSGPPPQVAARSHLPT